MVDDFNQLPRTNPDGKSILARAVEGGRKMDSGNLSKILELISPGDRKPSFEKRGITANEVLRRFVDLPKLFDLISTQTIFLPQLKRLFEGDPFECAARKSYETWDVHRLRQKALDLQCYAPTD
jgi:hypothetical protein